ncbi:MAG: DUF1320 domain-containing protein [Methylovulum sp.]|nr:DUF1320 domain-containing protein [Methylovulum sp.]
MYCTLDQLIAQFTLLELQQRAGVDPGTGELNEAPVLTAIAAASRQIDGYLRTVYPLPLSDGVIAESALPEMCGHIARSILYQNIENEPVTMRYKDAVQWLRDVQAKKITLGPTDTTVAVTGTMAVRAVSSNFDWNKF